MFQPMIGADNCTADSVWNRRIRMDRGASCRASSAAGSTDHKDDRECQWQANGESPGNRQAECRKQIYLRAQPINRHAVFSDTGELDSYHRDDAVTALQLPRTLPAGCAGIVNEKLTTGQVSFELLASPVIQMREWHLVWHASRKLQATAIGENHRQLAAT